MNRMCRVKLTDLGLKHYLDRQREFRSKYPQVNPEIKPPTLDEDGYYVTQLWCLLEEFGDSIDMGMDPPFVGCEIQIDID